MKCGQTIMLYQQNSTELKKNSKRNYLTKKELQQYILAMTN